MKKKQWFIAGLCAIVLGTAMFWKTGAPFLVGAQSRPTIVMTVAPQAAFVQELAGELVNVVTVLPPGANHETFSLPPQDMKESVRRICIWLWDCRRSGPAFCRKSRN